MKHRKWVALLLSGCLLLSGLFSALAPSFARIRTGSLWRGRIAGSEEKTGRAPDRFEEIDILTEDGQTILLGALDGAVSIDLALPGDDGVSVSVSDETWASAQLDGDRLTILSNLERKVQVPVEPEPELPEGGEDPGDSGETDSETAGSEGDSSAGGSESTAEDDTSAGGSESTGEGDTSAGGNESTGEGDTSAGGNESTGEGDTSAGGSESTGEGDTSAGGNESTGEGDSSAGGSKSTAEGDTSAGGSEHPAPVQQEMHTAFLSADAGDESASSGISENGGGTGTGNASASEKITSAGSGASTDEGSSSAGSGASTDEGSSSASGGASTDEGSSSAGSGASTDEGGSATGGSASTDEGSSSASGGETVVHDEEGAVAPDPDTPSAEAPIPPEEQFKTVIKQRPDHVQVSVVWTNGLKQCSAVFDLSAQKSGEAEGLVWLDSALETYAPMVPIVVQTQTECVLTMDDGAFPAGTRYTIGEEHYLLYEELPLYLPADVVAAVDLSATGMKDEWIEIAGQKLFYCEIPAIGGDETPLVLGENELGLAMPYSWGSVQPTILIERMTRESDGAVAWVEDTHVECMDGGGYIRLLSSEAAAGSYRAAMTWTDESGIELFAISFPFYVLYGDAMTQGAPS